MKSLVAICCSVLLLSTFSAAQILLGPSGSCGITKEGARDCSWASAIDIRKPRAEAAARQRSIAIRTRQYPTTQNNLASGAPFDAGSADYDRILVALTEAHLVNEATKQDFLLSSGSTLLLSKGEKYLLRNAGERNVTILVILIGQ